LNLDQFIDFIYSIALLLSLAILYDSVISKKQKENSTLQKIITGLIIAVIGFIIMSTPWEFSPGYFFDPRTVLMAISGLFFGIIPTFISMTLLGFLRIFQGGGGVIPGVLWVIFPACSALLWSKLRPNKKNSYSLLELYIFGIVIHFAVLLALFTLPLAKAIDLLLNVSLPILLIFPAGTALLGFVLKGRQERKKSVDQFIRLATVIEQLNEKVIITDLEGNPIYLNLYFEISTGYDRNEIIGQHFGLLKSGYHERSFYDELWNTISKGDTWRGQIVNRKKDGSIYYDEATIFPIITEKGEIISYASFQRDITDQIKMIDTLKSNEENLQTILNSIGDAVIATDIKGNIIKMNPVAEKLTGWNYLDAIEKPVSSILHIEDGLTRTVIHDPVESVLSNGRIGESMSNLVLVTKHGPEYKVSLSGTVISDSENTTKGIVMVFRDISEELKLRELMIHNEKMLSIGGLAAGMAHEINNPLAGMMQSAEVLANRLGKKQDSIVNLKTAENSGTSIKSIKKYMEDRDIFRMVDSIKVSGAKIASIIENMVSFSQSGELEKVQNNICELLDNTLNIAENDFNFKNIKLLKYYDKNIPLIFCISPKIQQVFLNILHNGLQAMSDGDIPNPQFVLRISYEEKKEMVLVEIEDNGPGMNDDLKKRILEPFYTTKPVGMGTGLGLSVAYFIIIEEHGGDIAIDTELGKGTKFSVRLPVQM